MLGFTARMYAIVINVVTPAMTSVRTSVVVFLQVKEFFEFHNATPFLLKYC